MKRSERSFVPLVAALILVAGCASQPPRGSDTLAAPDSVEDRPLYELTVRFFSRVGKLYMEVTTLVATEEPFSVRAADGAGRSVVLSGRVRESDGKVFQLTGSSFAARSPAQAGSPDEAFDLKFSAMDLKLDELSAGGAIHGPRYEFILRKAQRDGQQSGPANGSQPIRSETNRKSSAAGTRP